MRFISRSLSLALPSDAAQFASRASGPHGDNMDLELDWWMNRQRLECARSLGWQWQSRAMDGHPTRGSYLGASEKAGTAGDVTDQDGTHPPRKIRRATLWPGRQMHTVWLFGSSGVGICVPNEDGMEDAMPTTSIRPYHPFIERNGTGRVAKLQASTEPNRDRSLPIKEEEPNNLLLDCPVPGISSNHTDEFADLDRPPQRNLPARGFKPATLLAIGGGVMLYGWYRFGQGAREQR